MTDKERIIRINTVLARTGLSRSTMYRKIAKGTFPRQVPISVHGAGWHESSVNNWISNPAGYAAIVKAKSDARNLLGLDDWE